MATKWSTEILGKGNPEFAALLKNETTVILLRGKNVFGDFIFCYLKISYGDMEKLQEAIETNQTFNISDFGSVLAAGKGEPSNEVKAELAKSYPILETPKPISSKPAEEPAEKKAWDDY